MPISNPVLTINITEAPQAPPIVLLENRDPDIAPISDRLFWLNTVSDRLWVAKGVASVSDWVQVGGSGGSADIATILSAIVVGDGAVLTDGSNVIFED
ncbi:MAG: hypothetical protein NW214_04120 [Pseudanabaenaceae cyanobacterium bins.39]|nr:hypothetical protein [Pseudanabaenaceae cyanobacterium bins.39]